VRYFHITIKLIKIEEGKVEIDEIDLGFCLIHVLYRVLPCGYKILMGAYKIERKHNRVNKMTILGAKQILVFPNSFIYYEQDMAKSMIFWIIIIMCMKDIMKNGRL
jgi:hypothetical protein